ncbi:hypothetical protein F5050DRAFT_528569 [Lentinula boryana]|uniref:DUF6534 domain-containing protein n=1 Tax=Lentinula boryana TaxID=40481 RepID=A0ABQ8Q783_9AGAR|nr:hypothetical protein F5050DRAFT_528569 [Lentinula boryana]
MSSSIVISTLGPSFAGSLVAVGLSAILGFQVFLYFHIFPSDALSYKFLVGWIWIIDAVHTTVFCASMWRHLIVGFGNVETVVEFFPTDMVTVAITAVTALSVNGFYGWRLYKMSKHNWWLVGPIALFSVVQIGLAFTDAAALMKTTRFPEIPDKFKNIFVANIIVSATTDIIIAAARYYYIRKIKLQGFSPTQEILDGIMVFTINDGVVTCVIAIASVACLVALPESSLFISLYVTNSKFYSNSVLATLNLRNWYRHRYVSNPPLGLSISMMPATANDGNQGRAHKRSHSTSVLPNFGGSSNRHVQFESVEGEGKRVEIYLERHVESDVVNLSPFDLDVMETNSRKSTTIFDR